MKKIYLLLLIALFFAACSADDSNEILNQEKNTEIIYSARATASKTKPGTGELPVASCFNGLAAHTTIDVTAGLNKPIVNFVADAPSNLSASAGYVVTVEVQELADCEDINVASGLPVFFGGSVFYNVVANAPVINVVPADLPACYRWRFVFERSNSVTPCKSLSSWYDAPLF
ncbi:hypothetical protein GR160_01240 [Flavobacterium sp. Sd200]|uniref:hypothetical protein n=1 Tax=Flavobacterium sp. Sd200 TaxID=2692211 RepID=UPI0013713217|nr:hypothetical protein [Flavobacterium sp. Sd200]MXN89840.1 hypothetical protein [Flavobacterium sp. Sd200]